VVSDPAGPCRGKVLSILQRSRCFRPDFRHRSGNNLVYQAGVGVGDPGGAQRVDAPAHQAEDLPHVTACPGAAVKKRTKSDQLPGIR
jgi:hypothetical protein